jgi:hypothetical protein
LIDLRRGGRKLYAGTSDLGAPGLRRRPPPRALALLLALAIVVVGVAVGGARPAGAASPDPCDMSVSNPIVCENSKPGTPQSVWQVSNDPSIVGFATQISVAPGDTEHFKIKTSASSYQIVIYRLGWYGGDGARQIATVTPSATLPQTQPACLRNTSVGLVDCGNWAESASWTVPSDAVSGLYYARLIRPNGADNSILFVVRDDSSHSDLVYKTADATWEAYNDYGGDSFYSAPDTNAGRSFKVSYNRPLNIAEPSYLLHAEYPMIRFLERNGYDLSYMTDVDLATRGSELLNHKVYVSGGHDEYISGEERTALENARAAGVSLSFFSGNEMFWKTRWEPSTDGSNVPNRTLVCYKETLSNAKIDPTPTWTGTWMDPRFSPPADGGRPSNGLTGTVFTVNEPRNDSITVPAQDAGLRFWRNTSIASLQPGQTATLPAGTLGYEWDSDLDNGFRPAGLIDLSSTTLDVSTRLLDYGSSYGNGTATHSLTLYRAASGALVFGAGTVQWSWGLDDDHTTQDGSTPIPPDPRMQQATVNLFADMGAQPVTLMGGLVRATKSADTTPPTSAITSPGALSAFHSGDVVTITGSAADAGGGVVGGVEVSVDGGHTWHPATGRESWSYSWKVGGYGPVTLMSRAVDDSGNLEAAGPGVPVSVVCPCSLWSSATTPTTASAADSGSIELGVKFTAETAGVVSGIRFYKGSANTGTHVGSLWATDGTLLAQATFTNESATGWQEVDFSTPVDISANTTYIASYHAPNGGYALDRSYFTSGYDNAPLHAPSDLAANGQGVYVYAGSPTFPNGNFGASNYWVDVVFTPAPPDTTPPTVSSVSPAAGSSGFSTIGAVTATFSEPMSPGSITTSTFSLKDSTGAAVPATVSYDGANRVAELRPSTALVGNATYTATIKGGSGGVTDRAGNPLASNDTWTFTTASGPVCPCSLWSANTTPATASTSDTSGIEVGTKFTADRDGTITAVRFYKGVTNGGTHVGSLWASDGTLLARATFSNESASGWQQADLSSPVSIGAGTTYVVSYYAPNGGYALDRSYFASQYDRGFLHAPASASVAGGNGVYAYAGAPTFPNQSYQASNYWVDVVYAPDPPDTTPPTITSTQPAGGATNVSTIGAISATFSEAMNAATVTTSTISVRNAAGTVVAGTVSYDAVGHAASFQPSAALAANTSYTVTVRGGSGGVTDRSGNPLAANVSWSFTTASGPVCPCSLWDGSATPSIASLNETSGVEVGVRFSADIDGAISGIRFYKGSANTGTHVGSLWASDGTLLARATFGSESATGWQQVSFSSPVHITAGTTYVASYYAPNGGFALDRGYFGTAYDHGNLHAPAGANGVYAYGSAPSFPNQSFQSSNYWVDVVFAPAAADQTPPTVSAVTPDRGATGVSTTANVTATFSEAMNASSINGSTMTVSGPGGPLAGTVHYDAEAQMAVFDPANPLPATTALTVTLAGGTGGVADKAGNPLAGNQSWQFTTANGYVCPCTLWNPTARPTVAAAGDTGSVELGVKFRSDVAGSITGLRFYKGAGNTGTHVGSLWAANGTLLAQATFTNESATGWQRVDFANPVAIAANTTYVASYHAPNGGYSLDAHYFDTARDNGPLHAPDSGAAAGNGVYAYGGAPLFPNQAYLNTNYWVDVVFAPAPPDTTPPTVTGVSPADTATGVSPSSAVTATFSEPLAPGSVNASTFTLSSGGQSVAATVTYDGPSQAATLTPNAPLSPSTVYTATVKGGSGGVTDSSGNALASSKTWSFTTAAGAGCPCSLWSATATPAVAATSDASGVELGLTFRADVDGTIAGVRFYKGAGNTGVHVGNLWAMSGQILGTTTFTNETATGWQYAAFAAPVPVTANTNYVVSYYAPSGHYALNSGYFAAQWDNGPLHAPASSSLLFGNGLYAYSAASTFPFNTFGAGNYWVDVVFNPS